MTEKVAASAPTYGAASPSVPPCNCITSAGPTGISRPMPITSSSTTSRMNGSPGVRAVTGAGSCRCTGGASIAHRYNVASPMAEPFKNLIGPEVVRAAAHHLQRVSPGFDVQRFVQLASRGLAALELKQRVLHVTKALVATLPDDFAAAADVLEESLAPASDGVD